MRIVVVGREATDYGRAVREWMRDLEREHKLVAEWMSPDSPEGERFCRARDIVEYPTTLVVDGDMGRVIGMWRGTPMPKLDEVAYAARS